MSETDSQDSSESDGQWMQGAVKHPGAFKEYCKGKGLVDKEGNITQECITEGKNSEDPTIRKRATLAETFQKNRKDFVTFDELEEYQEKLKKAQGYYEKDGKLLFQDDMGEQFEIDFDINKFMQNKKNNEQVYKSSFSEPPVNKNMNDESKPTTSKPQKEDLTKEQYDAYWEKNGNYLQDGSVANQEHLASMCQETEGKSREECLSEVKNKMDKELEQKIAKKDMTNDAKDEKDKPKKVEVCEKELDMLRNKALKLDTLDQVAKNLATLEEKAKSLTELETKLEKDLKEKETKIATEKEIIRQDKIKKMAIDFQLPVDKLKNLSEEKISEFSELLTLAIRKPVATDEKQTIDMTAYMTANEKKAKALDDLYRIT